MKMEEKMVSLMYKLTKTCDPHTPESLYLGGTRISDIPQLVDEFMSLWLIEYDKRMKRFLFLRPFVERLFIKHRFVKFSEFQEIFKGSHTNGLRATKSITDLHIRHPIFMLADITNEKSRQQFLMNYKENDLKSYYEFMRRKNLRLYNIFHRWHNVAVAKQNRIHSWITGTPGSGKSELMKSMILQDIRQNMKQDCSIIVIDPNGDFTKEVAQFKENAEPESKDKLMYIDLDLFKGDYTPVINPFQLFPNKENLEREIDLQNQQIGKALVEISESFGQPLTAQQQTLMTSCVSILLEMQNCSLWDLHTFVSLEKNNIDAIPLVNAGKNSTNPTVRSFFRKMWENVTTFKDSKAGILVKTTHLLGMSSFANLVSGKSTVNLSEALESNKLVLFNLAIGNLGDKAPIYIGKIIVSLLQSISFKRAGLEKSERKPVYLYIDEFQDYVSDSMIRLLTQGRKYKMFLTIANQFVGQGMSAEEQKAIFGTTKIKIIGANSVNSLSALSKETKAEIEILEKLQVGQFMVKIGEAEPFILNSPTESLDNKNAMTDEQWQQTVAEQKAKYYRKKPIDDVLKEMIRRENNPHETLLDTPPTDTSVKTTPNRDKPEDKADFGEKFSENLPHNNNGKAKGNDAKTNQANNHNGIKKPNNNTNKKRNNDGTENQK